MQVTADILGQYGTPEQKLGLEQSLRTGSKGELRKHFIELLDLKSASLDAIQRRVRAASDDGETVEALLAQAAANIESDSARTVTHDTDDALTEGRLTTAMVTSIQGTRNPIPGTTPDVVLTPPIATPTLSVTDGASYQAPLLE